MAQELAAGEPVHGTAGDRACDVIVPIYNGYDAVQRCLSSLERHTPAPHRILLVDDASTEPRMAPMLRAFAGRRPGTTVLGNAANLGFVGAVNRAFEATHGDVVVLNSDTEVTAGWIECLLRCRDSHPAIGIVCPLSNNATILSIPGVPELFTRDDGKPDVDAIGECVRRAAERSYPRLPTAVGFCMLVTRKLLDRAGRFDPVYGRGYGEENDLSMRAHDLGFEIACCDDAYVHHAGEGSFGAVEGIGPERERNRARLERRWPQYPAGVAAWYRANPLRRANERANAAAERERFPGRPRVLVVVHRFMMRGGIEEHTRAIINQLKDDALFTVVLPHFNPGTWADFLTERLAPHLRTARFNAEIATPGVVVIGLPANASDPSSEEAFRRILSGGYDLVHFQSMVGWNTLGLPRLARESGARVVMSAHDLSMLCADYNMVTGPQNRPCGRDAAHGSDRGCVECLRGKSTFRAVSAAAPTIETYIDERFEQAAEAVEAADAIVCPSEYLAGRLRRAFGARCEGRLRVIGHGVADLPRVNYSANRPMLRVAVLGHFGARKGAEVVLDVARRLTGQRIVFEAWGPIEVRFEGPARAAGILLRGPYDPGQLPMALRGIDLVLVPTLMEESFCLVLSEAQRLGIPVAASRIGAIPERIREGETGFLFQPGDAAAIASLLVRLRDDRRPLEAVAARLREERPKTITENAAEYLALYRELLAQPGVRAVDDAVPVDSAELTRRCLQWPRARRCTPLGDDDYDRWIAGEDSTVPEVPAGAPAVQVVALAIGLNAAIRDCAAEWIVPVEEGDTLAEGALAQVARAAQAHPDATLLYFDEDAVSSRGERYDPVFKPRFSPELLRYQPYVAGACALHRERVLALVGLRSEDWSGIVDLAARLSAGRETDSVVGVRSLIVHRLDLNLRPRWAGEGIARPSVPVSRSPVSAFVRTVEAPEHALACIESLLRMSSGRIGEILVDLDEARSRELATALAARSLQARIVPTSGTGTAPLARALSLARSEWLAVVDARCRNFRAGWLDHFEQAVPDGFTAAIAPSLMGADRVEIPGWEVLGAGPWAVAGPPPPLRGESALRELYGSPREVAALSPRLLLIRCEAARAIGVAELANAGRFDVTHLGLEACAAGHILIAHPAVVADFFGTASAMPTSREPVAALRIPADVTWMRKRWGERLEDDPYYHPALRLSGDRVCAAPRFPARSPDSASRPRVCAFPFDRWGSGAVRVRQPCAALERAGRADVLLMPEHDTGRVPNRIEWRRLAADTLFAHNFFHDHQLLALEEYARESKGLRVLGLDDLLTGLPRDNAFAATMYPDIAERIARAASLCDRLVVSTQALADAYGASARDVRVIPNALDDAIWSGLDNRPRAGPRPRVGWAGAHQHLGDLGLLEPVVRATCREIDWVFFGMCPPAIRANVSEVHELVLLEDYPAKLASLGLDAAVAPLLDHPFNRAKSNLKILEYGVLGIPVIASDVEPYRGSPATIVGPSADQWIDAVRSLALDRDGAREAGARVREWVLGHGLLSARLDDWSRALTGTLQSA